MDKLPKVKVNQKAKEITSKPKKHKVKSYNSNIAIGKITGKKKKTVTQKVSKPKTKGITKTQKLKSEIEYRKLVRASETYKEYNKQRQRVRNILSRANKLGFGVDYELVPPRKYDITPEDFEYIKQLKPKLVYELVGVPYEEYKQRYREAYRQPDFKLPLPQPNDFDYKETPMWAQVIVDGWYEQLDRFSNARAHHGFKTIMDKLVADNGIEAVADMISNATSNGVELTYQIIYEGGEQVYFADMLNYLEEQGEIYKEDIMDFMNDIEVSEGGWSVE